MTEHSNPEQCLITAVGLSNVQQCTMLWNTIVSNTKRLALKKLGSAKIGKLHKGAIEIPSRLAIVNK